VHELPRIDVQRFEVPALPFGKEDIKGQRALAAAAHSRDHGEPIARDANSDVLEIMFAGVMDANGVIPPAKGLGGSSATLGGFLFYPGGGEVAYVIDDGTIRPPTPLQDRHPNG
jgi:hypothetical protein